MAAASGRRQRPRINNLDALQEVLEEIAVPEELPWDEHLVVTGEVPTAVADVEDDLERELAFYNQARRRPPYTMRSLGDHFWIVALVIVCVILNEACRQGMLRARFGGFRRAGAAGVEPLSSVRAPAEAPAAAMAAKLCLSASHLVICVLYHASSFVTFDSMHSLTATPRPREVQVGLCRR